MSYDFFSYNGQILPIDQATIPLSSVEYSYGFGVYETIRVSGGKINFAGDHCQRLMESAAFIELDHPFTADFVKTSIAELVAKMEIETCNVKVLLIGALTREGAKIFILALNPLFPDRKLYKHGAHCITVDLERKYPGAKTLNMLPSYLAYRKAKAAGAYDALLIDDDGCIREGTRTNFYGLRGTTIVSAPESDILQGVTRSNVLKVAGQNGFEVVEEKIKLSDVSQFDSVFITSTSTKIMPLSSINDLTWEVPSPALHDLMVAFDKFLADYKNS